MFRGSHEAKIDDKGRLKVPSAFKALMDAANVTQFFVTSTNGKWAEIWPLPEWEKVEQRLAKVSALDDAVEEFLTVVNFYGQPVEMDNQGRITVHPDLRRELGMEGQELHLMAYKGHVQILTEERYQERKRKALENTTEDLEALEMAGLQ